jgi:tetrahydromethanopterin S-methyltransferase subunit G
VLAGIAEELGRPLGFRTVGEVRAQMEDLGPWDGDRAAHGAVLSKGASSPRDGLVLSTWKQLLDQGSMQDGDDNLRATARMPVVRVSATLYDALGPSITVTGDRGSVTLPAVIAEIAEELQREKHCIGQFERAPETCLPVAPLNLIIRTAKQVIRRDIGILYRLRGMPFENRIGMGIVPFKRHPLKRHAVAQQPSFVKLKIVLPVKIVIDFIIRVTPFGRLSRLRHRRYAPRITADADILRERNRRIDELGGKRTLINNGAAGVISALNIGECCDGHAAGEIGCDFRRLTI